VSGIYDAPASELTKNSAGSEFGSVERGIAGDYELTIGGVFSEAKSKLNGSKGPAWVAIALSMVAFVAINFSLKFVLGLLPLPAFFSSIVLQAIVTLLTTPITVGVMLVGVKLAADVRASGSSIFSYFDMMLNLFLQTLLIYLIVFIGILLLVLPGIYLAFAYMGNAMFDIGHHHETPEGVDLSVDFAGPIVRTLAFAIDFSIRAVVMIAVAIVTTILSTDSQLGMGFFLVFLFLLEWFYPLLFEYFRGGQTPGKKAMGIYVVSDDLTPLSFSSALIR